MSLILIFLKDNPLEWIKILWCHHYLFLKTIFSNAQSTYLLENFIWPLKSSNTDHVPLLIIIPDFDLYIPNRNSSCEKFLRCNWADNFFYTFIEPFCANQSSEVFCIVKHESFLHKVFLFDIWITTVVTFKHNIPVMSKTRSPLARQFLKKN